MANWLRTGRFNEPTFGPSGAIIHWKKIKFRDFLIFLFIYIFFSIFFFYCLFLISFLFIHIIGKLISHFFRLVLLLYSNFCWNFLHKHTLSFTHSGTHPRSHLVAWPGALQEFGCTPWRPLVCVDFCGEAQQL
jgi:hypothetical protein